MSAPLHGAGISYGASYVLPNMANIGVSETKVSC